MTIFKPAQTNWAVNWELCSTGRALGTSARGVVIERIKIDRVAGQEEFLPTLKRPEDLSNFMGRAQSGGEGAMDRAVMALRIRGFSGEKQGVFERLG